MTTPSWFKDIPQLPIVRWPEPPGCPAKTDTINQTSIVQRPLLLGQPITFWQSGNADEYLFGDDCHAAEDTHRWMKSPVCRIAFNALFSGSVILKLHHLILVERRYKDLSFSATLNGRLLNVKDDAVAQELIEIPIPYLPVPSGRTCILILYCKTVIANKIIAGDDTRPIGMGLKQLWFTHNV